MGHSIQNEQQKKEIRSIYVDENGKEYNLAGEIDYVAGWYFKAASLISYKSCFCINKLNLSRRASGRGLATFV